MADDPKDVFAATHRFARISAQKARLVMDLIRGEPVEDALTKLRFSPRRASPMISKVLKSAMANATQKAGVEGEDLVVWRAFVDSGPTSKRWKPRAMGRAYPRLRRTCHLSVVLRQVPKNDTPKKQGGSREKPDEQPAGKGGTKKEPITKAVTKAITKEGPHGTKN
jgi:large subunit ribosomal protein L22